MSVLLYECSQPGRRCFLSHASVMHMCCDRTSAFLRFLSLAAERKELSGLVQRLGIASGT